MRVNVAVATVSGKAYYLIVNELRKREIPFLSLKPNEPIPIGIKVVITTEREEHLINHEKIIVYKDGADPETLINNILQTIHGKGSYERVVIGVDPGEIVGLAVLADGAVIETENCFSVEEALERVKNILTKLESAPMASLSVKIGDGVPTYKERLLLALDNELPPNIALESVREAGTSRCLNETKNRRGLRDMVSAIRIAGRNGHVFRRRKMDESNS